MSSLPGERRTIEVLDPTARGPAGVSTPPARLPSLRGKVLGLRVDHTWKSYGRFAVRFAALARERAGVSRTPFFDPGIRIGTTEEERRKVAGFVRDLDAAIVGLGTWGSCTSWSVHDTIEVLRAGKPAVAVVTEPFANLALTAARARGVGRLPLLVLPHPLEGRSAEEIERIAEERFAEALGHLAERVD